VHEMCTTLWTTAVAAPCGTRHKVVSLPEIPGHRASTLHPCPSRSAIHSIALSFPLSISFPRSRRCLAARSRAAAATMPTAAAAVDLAPHGLRPAASRKNSPIRSPPPSFSALAKSPYPKKDQIPLGTLTEISMPAVE
jgi:hypothetical protein